MENEKRNLLFFGDASLCRLRSSFYIEEEIQEMFDSADFVVGNLECPITKSTIQKPMQSINLSADSSGLHYFNKVSALSLANNHIQDFGDIGVLDTIKALEEIKLPYFGVGQSYNEALNPFCVQIGNNKIAVLGATRYANTFLGNWGTANDNCKELFAKIKQLKDENNFVIVFFHWGYEYVRIPSPRERKIAHKCIDFGADLIVGSHPHIYQGIETYRGKKIVFSLGNFIFHSSIFDGLSSVPNDPRLHISYMIGVDIGDANNYEIELIGYETTDKSIRLLTDEEQKVLLKNVYDISENLNPKCRWRYLKEYYMQTVDISRQNIKVRNDFQHAKSLSLFNRLSLYRNANFQDVKNRMGGGIIKVLRWWRVLKKY